MPRDYLPLVFCPICKNDFKINQDQAICTVCGQKYPIIDDRLVITPHISSPTTSDLLSRIKNYTKQFPDFYFFLVDLISPVFFGNTLTKQLAQYTGDNEECITLNLGSGPRNYTGFINVDIYPYRHVDILANIAQLPVRPSSVDFILIYAVLEHVPIDTAVVNEIKRVLKPGGKVLCYYPFIQGIHASPDDFSRHTDVGLKTLFREFKTIEIKPYGGPTSGLLWVLQEWVAIVLSFGNKYVYLFVLLVMMILTFPLKFLDYFLLRLPQAKQISSGFYIIAQKYE